MNEIVIFIVALMSPFIWILEMIKKALRWLGIIKEEKLPEPPPPNIF